MTIAERELSAEILAIEELEQAAHYLDLEPWILMRLRQPERELQFNLQVRRETGETAMLQATRIQHSTSRGPCMGPLIVSQSRTVADIRAEALQRTLQQALWGMPFGGSAGLIPADIDKWSELELRSLCSSFGEALTCRDNFDVLTPSRNLPTQTIAWMITGSVADREHLARFTGKPISMGGVDREYIAARFTAGLVRSAIHQGLAGVKIAILGFDSLAQRTAVEFESAGARITAAADCSGAAYRPSGLDVELLRDHVAQEGVIFGFPEAQIMSYEEMLTEDHDVLILNQGQGLLTKTGAKVILEAGGSAAEEALEGKTVIPSMIANFGLNYADFLEWRKVECGFCSEREFMRGMQGHVRRTWQDVSGFAHKHNLSLRKSAHVLALFRVAEAVRMKQEKRS
jgi:glutamate dehydrogenase/leucine dehydrogenase